MVVRKQELHHQRLAGSMSVFRLHVSNSSALSADVSRSPLALPRMRGSLSPILQLVCWVVFSPLHTSLSGLKRTESNNIESEHHCLLRTHRNAMDHHFDSGLVNETSSPDDFVCQRPEVAAFRRSDYGTLEDIR